MLAHLKTMNPEFAEWIHGLVGETEGAQTIWAACNQKQIHLSNETNILFNCKKYIFCLETICSIYLDKFSYVDKYIFQFRPICTFCNFDNLLNGSVGWWMKQTGDYRSGHAIKNQFQLLAVAEVLPKAASRQGKPGLGDRKSATQILIKTNGVVGTWET